jgi:hypothetical protein
MLALLYPAFPNRYLIPGPTNTNFGWTCKGTVPGAEDGPLHELDWLDFG